MAATRKRNKKAKGLTQLGSGETIVPRSPDDAMLEAFANPYPNRDYSIHMDCPEFTSLCPLTGQPDFARIFIDYIPAASCVESKSLKLYLFSYRNQGSFGEEIVNRILDDLVKLCQPRRMTVRGEFAPRGGIAIHVEAKHRKNKRDGS